MEKKKRPLSSGKKLIILLIVLALVVGAVYLGYYLMRYTFYDEYRQFISHISAPEDAGELELGKEKLEGYKGYKLALESEHLKLYLNESTSDVAILDKDGTTNSDMTMEYFYTEKYGNALLIADKMGIYDLA